ncbi:MAG: hypothetical protein A3B74_04905 [Candidatus Kerfeldbacteria bacterium RIFCSPHIGHO2_02_FULL_42_14]|uniref:Uncharacterized protein n=1 Tax=Candidatus Kerfeldbacteria bacterium RIFCSPHIGHO2_02_FULL_42_14 TaxID=1798540 RepID=A0A1G2AP43_9BACT|nr:MAG: hypothetical protein A3B74_04905 [Candidatus Kerfeldbacteria bacterium RIFCSPHIGHO2_02_FULL_42_14]OGY81060.1 MAG: hypothetical protein A3E60_03625 [Candidatus Kerfeldbacteria bacterium RIFCSPHIGHO2_12_FULL_42_13]OGY84878.1 MAG: hypothetical protein A3I91_05270 [Candidatus Kerfeldbacteria bacterium RIFCSPLOWO2_02_FULL_42_19]OGY86791.1 MAG: hypothetical protein A3G01_02570 [Candidatus Kerfeldbacteria bacterium RIFCSPLOWO2_12_FULL_43_9]
MKNSTKRVSNLLFLNEIVGWLALVGIVVTAVIGFSMYGLLAAFQMAAVAGVVGLFLFEFCCYLVKGVEESLRFEAWIEAPKQEELAPSKETPISMQFAWYCDEEPTRITTGVFPRDVVGMRKSRHILG